MCYGLVNKQYHFLNKPVSKEFIVELRSKMDELMDPQHEYRQQFEQMKKNIPRVAGHIFNSEDCFGETIIDSKNCVNCYAINNCEDSRNLTYMHHAADSRDCDYASPDAASHSYNLCSVT